MPQITRSAHKNGPDLAAVRKRLAETGGKDYWRSLDELADTEEFRSYLEREFPEGASELKEGFGRRQFLKVMGASLAFAGLTSCTRQPVEKIVPYVKQPEEIVPGKPLFYASAFSLGGFSQGVLVETHMGRPTKVEGNPDHPASLGSTSIFAQASVLEMYDPDRSQVVKHAGQIGTWGDFLGEVTTLLAQQNVSQGAGFRILTETVTSPTLADQIGTLLGRYPKAKWHQYEPVGRDNVHAGAQQAFGELVETQYRFERARVILSLDGDFLGAGPLALRDARAFIEGRRVRGDKTAMNRLYVVESCPSHTGAMADHRLPLQAGQIEGMARAIAAGVGVDVEGGDSRGHDAWVAALVRDLRRNAGACAVVAGEHQPAAVHALAHAMNLALGNMGKTVIYTDPIEANPVDHMASLGELVKDMKAGQVSLLVMLGGNPVYTAPADMDFVGAMKQVATRIHLSLYEDETSEFCHWHLPEAHPMESWGDARAADGTATIVQPLIEPLYGGKSAYEVLATLLGNPGAKGHDLVHNYWKQALGMSDFEPTWRKWLHDGVIEGTAMPGRSASLRKGALSGGSPQAQAQGLEINFRPDPTIWDGRFANLGWLQELPKALTRLTWDNSVLMSPSTAEGLGVENWDVVELSYRGRTVRGAVWVLPGSPQGAVTVHLGYGRTHAGRVGDGAGFNAYRLRTSDAPWFGRGLEIRKTGETYLLVTTQDHSTMEGRHLLRIGEIEEYRKNPEFVREMDEAPPPGLTLLDPGEHPYNKYAWAMTVDLNACIGCSACTIACQAENNIPVVGKSQVSNGREMHWIRVDRYFKGDMDDPGIYTQPVPCQQCEDAPCEVVCPVGATVHSSEGLNDMVYNRCVGTRYCSNNCPYKVRRFNFLHYAKVKDPVLKLLQNPDVTVRARGVMEKCTYCVQRIQTAKIQSELEDRKVRDGEIVTACQAVCPTQAIVFGDKNDPKSRVARLKAEKLNYGILTELNTRPRTSYLARLRNPNPEIEHA